MRKLSMEQVIENLRGFNPNIELLSTEYKDCMTKMDFRCNICGNEWKTRYTDIRQGIGCPVCGKEKMIMSKRWTYEQAKERVKELYPHLEVLGEIYEGVESKTIVRCNDCGYEREVSWKKVLEPKNVKNCPSCSGKFLTDNNRLSLVRPDLIVYFKDKNKAEEVSIGAREIVDLICPTCKTEYKMKVSDLVRKPFSCKLCSDGISRGEKILASILKQSGLQFEAQKKFTWSDNRVYDFYIPSLNVLCEVDGSQHRRLTFGMRTTPEKEQANDKYKDEMAKDNGIKEVIRIVYEEFVIKDIKEEYIKKLQHIIDFSKIDWSEVFIYCNSSNVGLVCDMYKEIKNKSEISRITGLSHKTVRRYINLGRELGMVED